MMTKLVGSAGGFRVLQEDSPRTDNDFALIYNGAMTLVASGMSEAVAVKRAVQVFNLVGEAFDADDSE